MKIVKTKEIIPKNVSDLPDTLIDFKEREKLHDNNSIPDFFVYIQDYAWNAFISHSTNVYKELRHEAQGIFVGHYCKDRWGEFVVATAYEEGNGNSQSAYVEMSEECLSKISDRCQGDGTLMLVWIHTHPGFGVFYSMTDYNCLKTSFYKPYQVGIVADILGKQTKGFKTKGTEVIEFTDYKLFYDKKNTLSDPYSKIKVVSEKDRKIASLEEEIEHLNKEIERLNKEIERLNKKNITKISSFLSKIKQHIKNKWKRRNK
jgi:proteasome lid subunit RPN8/RPN11